MGGGDKSQSKPSLLVLIPILSKAVRLMKFISSIISRSFSILVLSPTFPGSVLSSEKHSHEPFILFVTFNLIHSLSELVPIKGIAAIKGEVGIFGFVCGGDTGVPYTPRQS